MRRRAATVPRRPRARSPRCDRPGPATSVAAVMRHPYCCCCCWSPCRRRVKRARLCGWSRSGAASATLRSSLSAARCPLVQRGDAVTVTPRDALSDASGERGTTMRCGCGCEWAQPDNAFGVETAAESRGGRPIGLRPRAGRARGAVARREARLHSGIWGAHQSVQLANADAAALVCVCVCVCVCLRTSLSPA